MWWQCDVLSLRYVEFPVRRCRNLAKPLVALQQGCNRGLCPGPPQVTPGNTGSSVVFLGWYSSPWQQVQSDLVTVTMTNLTADCSDATFVTSPPRLSLLFSPSTSLYLLSFLSNVWLCFLWFSVSVLSVLWWGGPDPLHPVSAAWSPCSWLSSPPEACVLQGVQHTLLPSCPPSFITSTRLEHQSRSHIKRYWMWGVEGVGVGLICFSLRMCVRQNHWLYVFFSCFFRNKYNIQSINS